MIKFCQILLYTSIPLFIFAIFQYMNYDTNFVLMHPLAKAHHFHSFSLVSGNKVKLVPSFFGTAHRYAVVSLFLFFLGLAFLVNEPKKKFLLVPTACAFGGVFLSGSRVAFCLSIIGAMWYFLVIILNRKSNKRIYVPRIFSVTLMGLLMMLVSSFALLFLYKTGGSIGKYQIFAFYYALKERIPHFVQDICRFLAKLNYWGFGTGTMSQGLQRIPHGREWYEYQLGLWGGNWFENGIIKICFELGIIGLIAFCLFFAHLLYKMKKECRILIFSSHLRNIAISIYNYCILVLIWFFFFHHQVFGDATCLVIFWFFIGVLFKMKHFQNEAEFKIK